MKHRRHHRSSNIDEGVFGERTRYAKVTIFLLAAVPILATIAYGSTEIWAYIPLVLLSALIVILWIADGMKKRELAYSDSLLQLPLIGLILVGLIQIVPIAGGLSSTLSLDPYSTRFFTIRLIILAIFFAIALTFISDKKLAGRFAGVIIIFGSVMAFAGILQRLASPDAIYGMRVTPQAIPFGPFVNQHHFAGFMEMTIGLTLAYLLGDIERNRKALLTLAMVLMVIAVVMTGSRGGVISTLAVAATAVFGHFYLARGTTDRSRTGGLKVAFSTAGILLVAAIAVIALSGADPLARGLGIQSDTNDLSSGRTHFWSVALKIFLDNPVIGAGYDAFGVAFTKFDTWNGFFRVEQAHNDYLQTLADGGILAFLCVAAFIFLLFKGGLNATRYSSSRTRRTIAVGSLAGCVGVLVHSFFDFPLRTPSNAFFFLLLVVLATSPLGLEGKRTGETD